MNLLEIAEAARVSFDNEGGTVVMPGRTLAPQDAAPEPQPEPQPEPALNVPVLTKPRKPRGAGKGKGAALKDDPTNPGHLNAISLRKGPNGKGTVIFVNSPLGWHEQPRTKFEETLKNGGHWGVDAPGTVNARVHVTDDGQRMLLIG